MKINHKPKFEKLVNIIILFISAVLFLAIIILFMISFDYSINKQGTILPIKFTIIRAKKDGLISKIRVQNGQFVNKGDTLFVLDHYDIHNKLKECYYECKIKRANKIKIENEIKYEEKALLCEIDYANNYSKISELEHKRILDDYSITQKYYKQLKKIPFSEEFTQYGLEKSNLLRLNSEIEGKIAQVKLLKDKNKIYELKILDDEIEIIKNKIIYFEHLLQNSNIITPDSGIIYELFPEELLHSYSKAGGILCQVFHHNTKWVAKLFIEDLEMSEIKLNQKAEVDLIGYDRSKYGYFNGEVHSISPNLTIDEENNKRYLICEVLLTNYSSPNDSEYIQSIKPGLLANVSICIENKSIFKIIYEKIF